MKRAHFLPILLWLVLLAGPAPAAVAGSGPADGEADAAPAAEPQLNMPGVRRLTALHEYVSENVEALSWKVDSFFGATRVYQEYSGNYLQLRGSLIYGRGGEFGFDGRGRLKLDLPNLEEKVNLVFESDEEDETGADRITTGTPFSDTTDDKSLNASLQFVLSTRDRFDLRLQPGLKLGNPLDPFIRLRARLTEPLNETWLTRTTFTPGWYETRGWEARLRFDLERAAGRSSLFRSTSEGVWLLDDSRDVTLIQTLLFTHPLGDRDQMAYEAGVTAEVDPRFQDTSYFASTRYRRNIHRGWIFLELKPQIVFEREEDFAGDASFVVTLEMLFGGEFL